VQALIWDYSPIVAPDNVADEDFYSKKLPAESKGVLHLVVDHLLAGRYQVTLKSVGFERNDAYSAFVDMGSPTTLSPLQVKELKSLSDGSATDESFETIANGEFVWEKPFRGNDVYLLQLKRIAEK
jgi:xylan 1,4-beta-xylosidase